MKKHEEGRILENLQEIGNNKDGLMSDELYKMKKQGKKRDFMEGAESAKSLESMQKEISKSMLKSGDEKLEGSKDNVKSYYNALGIDVKGGHKKKHPHKAKKKKAPKHKAGHIKHKASQLKHKIHHPKHKAHHSIHHIKHLEKKETSPEEEGGEKIEEKEKPQEKEVAAPQKPEEKAKGKKEAKEFDLKSLKKANTKTLLRKLIEINAELHKQMNEIIEAMKIKNATFSIPDGVKSPQPPEAEKSKELEDLLKKETEKSLTIVEKEIFIDIPSLKIKEYFSTENDVQQKVKEIEQNKKFLGLFSLKNEPDEKQKLKALSIENLKKVAKLSDERKQVVAISYILRQFLEVKFRIPKTLTYTEMVAEIQARDIDPYIKAHLIELFTKLPEAVYRGTELHIKSGDCFDLANKTLQKLSDKNPIKRTEISIETSAQSKE